MIKCPHCGYGSGYRFDTEKYDEGEKGEFYKLPINASRNKGYENEEVVVYGCPECFKMFINTKFGIS